MSRRDRSSSCRDLEDYEVVSCNLADLASRMAAKARPSDPAAPSRIAILAFSSVRFLE
jgi:hypothetical protein